MFHDHDEDHAAGSVRVMFVLDTNIVSELRKVRSGKANLGVASWAEQVPSAESTPGVDQAIERSLATAVPSPTCRVIRYTVG